MKKRLEIVRAVCCDNLSDTEAAMVFNCSVASVHQAVADVMRETGAAREELWKLFGSPEIHVFKPAKQQFTGAKQATLRRLVEQANDRIRANPYR